MKKLLSYLLAVFMCLSIAGCSSSKSSASKDSYKVMIVQQLDHASLDQIADAIKAEFKQIEKDKGITVTVDLKSGQNDQSTLKQIASQAISDGYDALVPIATLAAQVCASEAEDTKTPVIYAAVSDPESAQLTDVDYVTGTSDALNTESIIDMMLAQKPDLKKVGLLYSKKEVNSEKSIKESKALLKKKGISYVEKTGDDNSEVVQAASTLAGSDVQSVFTPTDNVVMAAEGTVAQTFVEAGIPHYTGADSFVTKGAFATCGVNYTELGTKTADLVDQALTDGFDDLEDYYLMDGGIITVNTETAKALNIDYKEVFKDKGEIVEVITSEK